MRNSPRVSYPMAIMATFSRSRFLYTLGWWYTIPPLACSFSSKLIINFHLIHINLQTKKGALGPFLRLRNILSGPAYVLQLTSFGASICSWWTSSG